MASCASIQIRPLAALAALVLAFSPAQLAARSGSGGEMGPVSRATIGISVSVAPRLEAERAATGAVQLEQDGMQPFCIWSNAPVGTFSVTAAQVARASSAADGPPAAYELEWRDGAARARAIPVSGGSALTGLAARSREGCQSAGASGLIVRPASVATDAGSRPAVFLLLIAPD